MCLPVHSFFFSSRRLHTRLVSDWSSDVCSSDLEAVRRCSGVADGVLVVGGDGALNRALPGALGSDLPVGMLPRGTVNVWAREIGLPPRPEDAIAALAAGETRRVDVGRIDWPADGARSYFLLMA